MQSLCLLHSTPSTRPAQPWGSRRKRGKGNKCVPISLLYQSCLLQPPCPTANVPSLVRAKLNSGKYYQWGKSSSLQTVLTCYANLECKHLVPQVQGPSLSCHASCRNSDLSLQQRLGCRHQQEGEPLVSSTSMLELFHEGYHRQPIAHKGGKTDLEPPGKNLHSLTSFLFPHKYLHSGRKKGPDDFPKMVLEYKSN